MEPHIGRMGSTGFAASVLRSLAACAVILSLIGPAGAADAIFPVGSRLGLAPTGNLKPSTTFPGFEDEESQVFIRLVTLPADAYAEIEKTMTNEALKKQGLLVEKRETTTVAGANGVLVIVGQETPNGRIRKWLLIAPVDNLTALISVEIPVPAPAPYPDSAVRAALASVAARPVVPVAEQLTLVPFAISDMAGLRLVRVVPGVAVQLTDGPKDTLEATEQPQLVIAAAPGGPDPRDREQFAREAMTTMPPLKDMRVTSVEPMRVNGQPGYEVRAEAKNIQTNDDIQVVQWIRFGPGGFVRILGLAPKDKWADAFPRFRAVRDGLEPR